MKKTLFTIVSLAAVATLGLVALSANAANPYDAVASADDNPAFTEDSGVLQNEHLNELEFHEDGSIVILGDSGEVVAEVSVVEPYDDGRSVVRPTASQ